MGKSTVVDKTDEYHPDVSTDSQAGEVFKSIPQAYEILSNEATRSQYDRELRLQKDTGRQCSAKWNYSTEFEDGVRIYKWAEVRQKMQRERYWEPIMSMKRVRSYGKTEEIQPKREVPWAKKLDAGYKIGYVIAWVYLAHFDPIVCKLGLWENQQQHGCSSGGSHVGWLRSYLVRFASLPQGALLTLVYMSIKLQVDLKFELKERLLLYLQCDVYMFSPFFFSWFIEL
ncbi:hypothetical protein ACFX2J_013550 [Malus domestica]